MNVLRQYMHAIYACILVNYKWGRILVLVLKIRWSYCHWRITSPVWKFFGFPSRDGKIIESDKKKQKRVFCKLCKRDYSYVGNTTNLWQHLEESHIREYRQAKEEAKEASESKSQCESSSDAESTQEASQSQPLLNEVLSRKQPYPRNSARLKMLNDSVCYFISKDMQDFEQC